MSIASELTALQADITAARTAIVNKGGTVTSGGGSSQLATDIATIQSQPTLQSKSVIYVSNGSATVTPDSGYDGLSSVAVTIAIPIYDGGVV